MGIKAPREQDLVRAALEYMRLCGLFVWRNNTGAFRGVYRGKNRFVRFGAVGSPDILGVPLRVSSDALRGRLIAVELKRPGRQPTDAQAAFLGRLRDAGCLVIVAHTIDELRLELACWGIRP